MSAMSVFSPAQWQQRYPGLYARVGAEGVQTCLAFAVQLLAPGAVRDPARYAYLLGLVVAHLAQLGSGSDAPPCADAPGAVSQLLWGVSPQRVWAACRLRLMQALLPALRAGGCKHLMVRLSGRQRLLPARPAMCRAETQPQQIFCREE